MIDQVLSEYRTKIHPRRFFSFETSIVAVFSIIVSVLAGAALYRATFRYSFNLNEGWNASIAVGFMNGLALYYPLGGIPYTNNYPPLSFIVIGELTHVIPDAVFAGRALAGGTFVAIIFVIIAIVRRIERDTISALVAGLSFALFMLLNSPHYVAADDPQMLAHLVILTGLFVYVRNPRASHSSILAAIAILIGLFVKHNPLALPTAMGLWLLIHDRRSFIRFAVAGIVSLTLALAVCLHTFGSVFVESLLVPRAYSFGKAQRDLIFYLVPLKFALVGLLLPFALQVQNQWTWLWVLYAAASIALCGIIAGGEGIGSNAQFDVLIALALASGHVVSRLGAVSGPLAPALRVWAILGFLATALLNLGIDAAKDILLQPGVLLADLRAKQAETLRLVDAIAAVPGPALCEHSIYCYWAGKPPSGDLFNFRAAWKAGVVSDGEFVRRIADSEYGTVELQPYDNPERMLAALQTRYRRLANTPASVFLYVRKSLR